MNSTKRDESVASGAKHTLLCIRGHFPKCTEVGDAGFGTAFYEPCGLWAGRNGEP
jgi:hypothetical protein